MGFRVSVDAIKGGRKHSKAACERGKSNEFNLGWNAHEMRSPGVRVSWKKGLRRKKRMKGRTGATQTLGPGGQELSDL